MILEAARLNDDGELECPVCSSTSFTMKRSGRDRAMWGLWGLLPFVAPKKHLTCTSCGVQLKIPTPAT